VLTWKHGYVNAGDLQPDTPLVPFYNKFFKGTAYEQVFQPADGKWQQTHRMVAEDIYGPLGKQVVHYKNEIKRDNRPINLEPMGHGAHSLLTLEKHKVKIVDAVRKWKRSPENRKLQRELATKQWADRREHMTAALRKMHQSPEYKANHQAGMDRWKQRRNAQKMMSETYEGIAGTPNANHRVVSVKKLEGTRRVYDLSVPRTNNFALNCGVFVHNCLFMLGIQWVRIDWPGREIRNLTLPTNFPRAISNKYAKVMGDLWSQLVQGDIPVNWIPSTDDPNDENTASICERVREVIDAEAKTRTLKRDLGFWVTYTGNGFLLPFYDYSDEYGTTPVQMSQCQNCGKTSMPGEFDGAGTPPKPPVPCPNCSAQALAAGTPPPPPQYGPAANPDGSAITQDMPIGCLKYEVLSPFEVYWDNTRRIGTPQHWFFRPHLYDVSKARALWPDFATKISEGMNEPMRPSRNYLIAIAYAGAYLTGTTGTGEAAAREEMRRQVTAWEYREDPTVEYPQGVYAVRVGEEITELKPLPNVWGAGAKKGQPFHGLVHFHQEISGGAWAKSRANDLISIQARRNIIESNLQLTAQRTGAPKLLSPIGSGLKAISGQAGQWVEYKPITFGGTSLAKPEYLEAALGNVQPLVLLLKELDDAMEKIAGTYNVSGGDVPPGVTAASALAFLSEKSNRAISPLKEQWAEAWSLAYQYGIEIARQHWTDERILAILGRNQQWQFQRFKKADLSGAVNVSIDYEALFPKSQATERANIMQLAQMGVIQPAMDEDQSYNVLSRFGMTELKPAQNASKLQAQREWDEFITNGTQPRLIPMVQDPAIHLKQHKEDACTQEFDDLPLEQQSVWIAHIMATQNELVQQSLPIAPGAPPPPNGNAGPHPAPAGHAGSQKSSQAGAAHGNMSGPPAPIRKGEAAADSGPGPAPAIGIPGPPPPA